MAEENDAPRPRWDRALDPLRHEAAMFRVLVAVVVLCAIAVAIAQLLT